MPNDDYYTNADGEDDAAAPSKAGDRMEGGSGDPGMGKEDHETTLIPRAMFEGKELKPGDEFYFTVVAVHDEEVEVSYKHDEGKEEGEGDDDTHEKAFDKFAMMGGGGGNPGNY